MSTPSNPENTPAPSASPRRSPFPRTHSRKRSLFSKPEEESTLTFTIPIRLKAELAALAHDDGRSIAGWVHRVVAPISRSQLKRPKVFLEDSVIDSLLRGGEANQEKS